jgi:AcrR family transcriptional regulator
MTRAYRNDLRAAQAEQTRERIVEALAEQLGEGMEDFSIPRVAERAGVSVRTVYHHLPNRDAQIEAVARWLDRRITGAEPPPETLDDVLAMLARIVQLAVQRRVEVRAQLVPGVARLVRERRRRAREKGVERAIARHCTPAEARLAAAAANLLIGADTGFALADRYGLDDDDMIETHQWMVRAVIEAIRRGDVPRTKGATPAVKAQPAAGEGPPAGARGGAPRSRSTPSAARRRAGGSR